MDKLKIRGGTPLQGHIKAAGAKNAMTKLLVASLLSDKKCTFHNVPNIGDVEITVNLCREIGSEIHWDQKKQHPGNHNAGTQNLLHSAEIFRF